MSGGIDTAIAKRHKREEEKLWIDTVGSSDGPEETTLKLDSML
jgi:hypothetical protein